MPIHCVYLSILLIAGLLLQTVFAHCADRLQSGTGYEIFADKRMELGEHLRKLPMGYYSDSNIGKISSILSADMVFMEETSMKIIAEIVSDVFSQIILNLFMFFMHPILGAIMLLAEIIIVMLAFFMNKQSLEHSGLRQQAIENMTGAILEYTEGIGIIKIFSLAGKGAKDLRDGFQEMEDVNIQFEKNHTPWHRCFLVVYCLATVAMITVAIGLYSAEILNVGYLIGMLIFVFHAFAPMKHLYQQDARITIMSKGMERIEALYNEQIISDVKKIAIPEKADEEITFEHVCFSYGDEEVLHDINFNIKHGETVALVGSSGSGKSTIASLLARFWDVNDGAVKVRGVNVKDTSVADLMSNISMVFQKVYLFQDTIYNNISMGRKDASEEEVYEAAKKARCYDFIMKLPYGFQTIIGEGGSTLSGGEAQRISIARCILKDSPIVILDEATASIDADNESYIQQAMRELCRNKTSLVIAHKLGTIINSDKIIVVENGEIAEAGTHNELLSKEGVYNRMVTAREQINGWSTKEAIK